MKLLYCKTCEDIVKLTKATRTCRCGATGGHYKVDGYNAIYYGPAIPLGFTNGSFIEAIRNQPEYGDGYRYTSFVIPKVCPTITHVDSEDYESIGLDNYDEVFDELMDVAEKDRKIKKNKIKNVFKDETFN